MRLELDGRFLHLPSGFVLLLADSNDGCVVAEDLILDTGLHSLIFGRYLIALEPIMDTLFEKGLANWSLNLLEVCNRELQIDLASILRVTVAAVFCCFEPELDVRQLTHVDQPGAVDELISVNVFS